MSNDFGLPSQLGRYTIEKRLGRGASGSVFLAFDTSLQVKVALKVLNPHHSEQEVERFKREIILARKLAHPGICRVFDWNEHEGTYFISMEYIEGESLETVINEAGVLAVPRACRLVRALCRALAVAHREGIIHRDLKPSNIIVTAKDQPVILDFGMATGGGTRRLTEHGTVFGTLSYISPEALTGAPITARSDLFSLGVIFYRAVTGRLPFVGDNPLDLVEAHRTVRPLPPSLLNPSISPALDRLLLEAVATDPIGRTPDAPAFNAALQALAEDATDTVESASDLWRGDVEQTVSLVLSDFDASTRIRQCIQSTTVLFSDIAGITAFFDQHGDIKGRKRILRHNELLFPAIERHRGTVIKTIGDAILALFPSPDDGVRAAIAMQQRLSVENAARPNEEPLRVRVAIHSGQAVVEKKDVFGDTVNVAARICSKTDPERIFISEVTQAQLRAEEVELRFAETVSLKGKPGEFKLFEVIWHTGAALPTDSITIPEPMLLDHTASGRAQQGPPALSAARRVTRRSLLWSAVGVLAVVALGVAYLVVSRSITPSPIVAALPLETTASPPPAPVPAAPVPPEPSLELPPSQPESKSLPPRSASPKGLEAKRELVSLQRLTEQRLREKALAWLDVPGAARSRQEVEKLAKRELWDRAKREQQRLLAQVEAVVVDRTLVMNKLRRTNGLFDRAKDAPTREQAQVLVDEAIRQLNEQSYERANRSLQAAAALLR